MNKHQLLLELNNLESWLLFGAEEIVEGAVERIAALKAKIKAEEYPK